MIVPMKKINVIVQAKDADSAVDKLRSLGFVHIEHQQPPLSNSITNLREDITLASAAINNISAPEYLKLEIGRQKDPADWKFVAKHIVELAKRLEQLEDYSRALVSRIQEWEHWGDFVPDKIEELKQKNIYIRLYQVPVKQFPELPSSLIVKKIFLQAGFAHCVVITRSQAELPFKEIPLPKMGLLAMRQRLYEDERMHDLIVDDLCRYLIHREALMNIRRDLEKELEFSEAVSGMGQEGAIAYLAGYAPVDALKPLEKTAKLEKWGLLARDPAVDEEVPTLLRNGRWIALIQPVFRLLGVLPGYRELDVSPLFLIFFSLFVGILIGDAGYGAVYLALAVLLRKLKGATLKNKNIFLLLYLLSSSAIIWGILTGTFFGQDWLMARNIKPVLPALNNPITMQTICFLLGAIHLTLAHTWRALVKFPNRAFLADLGWIAVLWTAYFLACTLILAQPFPGFGLLLALGGIVLILFFNEPRRNIVRTLGAGFTSVTFGLSFMSAFTDVVSYVRLFAVGLATVAIANTTNAIAMGMGSGVAGFSAGILIRVVGHALNILLGPIAVLVHGVRLNVLEFGLNHTNITWSGKVYKPLAEQVI